MGYSLNGQRVCLISERKTTLLDRSTKAEIKVTGISHSCWHRGAEAPAANISRTTLAAVPEAIARWLSGFDGNRRFQITELIEFFVPFADAVRFCKILCCLGIGRWFA